MLGCLQECYNKEITGGGIPNGNHLEYVLIDITLRKYHIIVSKCVVMQQAFKVSICNFILAFNKLVLHILLTLHILPNSHMFVLYACHMRQASRTTKLRRACVTQMRVLERTVRTCLEYPNSPNRNGVVIGKVFFFECRILTCLCVFDTILGCKHILRVITCRPH